MHRSLRQLWITAGGLVGLFAVTWVVYMPYAMERGIWQSDETGQIMDLNALRGRLYSVTGAACTRHLSFPAHLKLVEMAQGVVIAQQGDTLVLHTEDAIAPTVFRRRDALPNHCTVPDPETPASKIFNALWSAMDTYYPFFDQHQIDWSTRSAMAPQTGVRLEDIKLFDLLTGALSDIDDGQVQLIAPFAAFTPEQMPADSERQDTSARTRLLQNARNTVAVPLIPVDATGIDYALLPNKVVYVLIRHLAVDTPFGSTDRKAMAGAFADVAAAADGADAMIIDVRYAAAGSAQAVLGVTDHFVTSPTKLFAQATGDTLVPATSQPYGTAPINLPVFILTGPQTASAGEVLTLALRELPQVTTIGQRTAGKVSPIQRFTLPNGWMLGLPVRSFTGVDGTPYNGVGLRPDDPVAGHADELLSEDDALLRAVLRRVANQ